MGLYRDSGVVLRTHKLGEADRIVSLLLHDSGLVRAVAKGVRRTSSRFGARLEPFSHVDLQKRIAERQPLRTPICGQLIGEASSSGWWRGSPGLSELSVLDRRVAELSLALHGLGSRLDGE